MTTKKVRFTDIKELEFSYDPDHPPVWHKIIGARSAIVINDTLRLTDPESKLRDVSINSISWDGKEGPLSIPDHLGWQTMHLSEAKRRGWEIQGIGNDQMEEEDPLVTASPPTAHEAEDYTSGTISSKPPLPETSP